MDIWDEEDYDELYGYQGPDCDGDEDDEWGCCFPDACCMPGEHLKSECHTAEMMEDYAKQFEHE